MTELLEQAIAKLKNLPANEQDAAGLFLCPSVKISFVEAW